MKHQSGLGRPLSRRSVLRAAALGAGVTAATAGLSACTAPTGSTSGLTTVRVAFGWILNVEWAGYFLADHKGYYRDEGISVQFIGGGPNTPSPVQSLASNSADIGVATSMSQIVQAIGQGNDFKMIGSVFQTHPGALLSLADKPITTAAALARAKVLGQDSARPWLDGILRLASQRVSYRFVPVGFDPSPLVEKQGDVYTCYLTNQPLILEEKFGLKAGSGYRVVTYADLGLKQYGDTLFTKTSYLRQSRDVLRRFMRATIRGWQDNEADPAAAAKLAVQHYGADLNLDLSQQTQENTVQTKLIHSDYTAAHGLLRIDPDTLTHTMWPGLQAARFPNLPRDPRSTVDTALLDSVYGSGNRVS